MLYYISVPGILTFLSPEQQRGDNPVIKTLGFQPFTAKKKERDLASRATSKMLHSKSSGKLV